MSFVVGNNGHCVTYTYADETVKAFSDPYHGYTCFACETSPTPQPEQQCERVWSHQHCTNPVFSHDGYWWKENDIPNGVEQKNWAYEDNGLKDRSWYIDFHNRCANQEDDSGPLSAACYQEIVGVCKEQYNMDSKWMSFVVGNNGHCVTYTYAEESVKAFSDPYHGYTCFACETSPTPQPGYQVTLETKYTYENPLSENEITEEETKIQNTIAVFYGLPRENVQVTMTQDRRRRHLLEIEYTAEIKIVGLNKEEA